MIHFQYSILYIYWFDIQLLDILSNVIFMDRKIALAIIAVAVVVIAAAAVLLAGNSDEKDGIESSDIPSGKDTRLTILGNADLDDDLDDYDVRMIEAVIENEGTVGQYPYADANNDGVIDAQDVEFVKKLVSKDKMVIYYYNVDGEIASVHYPLTGSIIATYNKTLEASRTLGLSDQVVGTDDMTYDWPTYFPEFQSLPSIGNRMSPSVEKILDIDPDAYLCGTKKWFGATLESDLAGTGIDVVRLPTWEEGQVLSGMLTLGFITQHESQAQKYLDWAEGILEKVDKVVDKIAEKDRPTVLVLDANNYLSTKKAGSGQYENSIAAGGYNIVKDIGSTEEYYTKLSMEWILKKDPQYIVFSQGSTAYQWSDAELKAKYDALAEEFKLSSAYVDGNMHIINLEVFIGPSYPISVMYMAKWFYPEEFEDVDVSSLLQEYIDTFCHIDMDVAQHGGFSI